MTNKESTQDSHKHEIQSPDGNGQRKREFRFTGKDIERMVIADRERPCLFGVLGPCMHPDCLDAHYKTVLAAANAYCRERNK